MSGIFRFKQFDIDQTGCAMKINTDGVLVGALANADNATNILDIGTGTGVIALMLAQRFPDAIIEAVETDPSAANTAINNFNNSIFGSKLTCYTNSFQQFFELYPDKRYDLIVSNPPFYINSLASPGAGKTMAKHADALFFEQLMVSVPEHLQPEGAFCLILPMNTADLVKGVAEQNGLYLQQVMRILSYPRSIPHRELLTFGLRQTNIRESEFVIYDEPRQYSAQYRTALREFFTIF